VARFSLRRYDVQAQVAMILSFVSVIFLLALIVLAFQRLDTQSWVIPYSPKSFRMAAIVLCAAIAFWTGVFGLGFGLNSAGQRRNDKPAQSWIGFFVGAASVTLTLIVLAAFWLWKESVI